MKTSLYTYRAVLHTLTLSLDFMMPVSHAQFKHLLPIMMKLVAAGIDLYQVFPSKEMHYLIYSL